MTDVAAVKLWGTTIGAVAWDAARGLGTFEYTRDFQSSGIQPAPIVMPLSAQRYQFPALSSDTFYGLPGMLADSLPDKYGNALIDAWLARRGEASSDFNPVQRLCYTGSRGIGALEYEPSSHARTNAATPVDVAELVSLANAVLSERQELDANLSPPGEAEALTQILQVGTSAGGARAKAVIAWNRETNEVRSGQVEADDGFEHWLLKFDGIDGNGDRDLTDPSGFGLIEYAYYLMAKKAGIHMSECQLFKENGRSHFMTRRFDRLPGLGKLHMQSLGAMQHFDFNQPGANSYEQVFGTIKTLELGMDTVEEQFRRMAFNIMARNQDDHVKNIAFLMDKAGYWYLSPAYDMTYSYKASSKWVATHQMSLNGKRDGFDLSDFAACARLIAMRRGRYLDILQEVQVAVKHWQAIAEAVGVSDNRIAQIRRAHRTSIL